LDTEFNEPDDSESGVRRIGLDDIELLVSARGRYEQMYRTVGGLPAGMRLVHFLNEHALPTLRADYDPVVERQLFRAVGSLVALSGVCAYDAGRQRMAKRQFFDAHHLARLAGDPVLEGHVASLLANQALRTGQLQRAIEYAGVGLDLGSNRLTPALRADLHCLTAEAYAQLGYATAGLTNMRQAEADSERIRLEDEPLETRHLTPDVVVGRNAVMHRQLGRLQEARAFFAQANTVNALHPRAGVNRLAGELDLLIAAREYTHAANVGLDLLSSSAGMESWLVGTRIRAAMDQLLPHKSWPEVREFCGRARRQLRMPL
jgi:tetratricopeptide (TPR) repeat protein